MKNNILRQLKDIQYQADRILTGSPSISDIRNFARYSTEINDFLLSEVDLTEVHRLVRDIPNISEENINVKKGLLFSLLPGVLWTWFYERNVIEEAKEHIQIAKGKYASIEFMLKNYLS